MSSGSRGSRRAALTAAFVSVSTYLGMALVLAGGLSRLLVMIAVGLALACLGAWWPWPTERGAGGRGLDAFVPEFQFGEVHELRMRADATAVYRSLRAVTAGEIRLFRALTSIRSPRLPGQPRRESILQPDWNAPILDVATRSGFVWLADEPDREIVVGTQITGGTAWVASADAFRDARSGVTKAAMNFRIEPDDADGYVRVTTETRVVAIGARARRGFGLYWAFIYPGSSLIRYGWLRAIRRRAEAAGR